MKTKYFVIITFLFWSVFSLGQTKTDYFKSIVDTTSNKQLKLSSLDSLIFLHKKANELQISANYVEEFVDLALEIENYEAAMEVSISLFFMINTRLGHPERALKIIEKVEPFIDKTDDSYYKGGIYIKKGGGYFNGKDYQKSIEYYTKAIELYGDKDSIYEADAIFFRGQAYFEIGNFIESINNYKLASQYYENLGDKDYTFYTLASVISIYGINGFTEKAIKERQKLIDKKLKIKFYKGLSVDYYNQFSSYKKLKNRQKQEECLIESLKYNIENENFMRNKASIHVGLSGFYLDTDISKSKEHLNEAKKTLQNSEKSTIGYKRYKVAEAKYLAKINQKDRAINIYLTSLKNAKKSNDASMVMKINRELSEVYNLKGDYKNSIKFHKAYTKIKDSIFNRTKSNALAYYQTLYETEKQQSEIKQQQTDIDILAAENQSKNRLMIFGGIGLFLAFLLILLYRNREHFKKKNDMQRTFAQNLLLSQDFERKRISKDLHDSLGQSLLLVKNKMSHENDEAKNLLNDAIDEMRNVSRSLYPIQLKQLGITSAIERLLEQLDQNYPDTYIFGDLENIDGLLTSEHELNLFRIIQECLSNVIKHAKAQSAKLELHKEKNQIVMTLQDNGVGFDFLSKFKNLKSLGLKTIKERVRYINGVLRVESASGNGSKFKVVIQTS